MFSNKIRTFKGSYTLTAFITKLQHEKTKQPTSKSLKGYIIQA
jgi:hypothetical protein